jgi:hypothetical protein
VIFFMQGSLFSFNQQGLNGVQLSVLCFGQSYPFRVDLAVEVVVVDPDVCVFVVEEPVVFEVVPEVYPPLTVPPNTPAVALPPTVAFHERGLFVAASVLVVFEVLPGDDVTVLVVHSTVYSIGGPIRGGGGSLSVSFSLVAVASMLTKLRL